MADEGRTRMDERWREVTNVGIGIAVALALGVVVALVSGEDLWQPGRLLLIIGAVAVVLAFGFAFPRLRPARQRRAPRGPGR